MLMPCKSVLMADYQGLTHQQLEELRKELEKAGGMFTVVKNTLLLRALRQMGVENLAEGVFVGPIGLVISREDEVAALSIFSKFIKKTGAGEIKFGVLENRFIEKEKMLQIVNLPGMEALRGQLVGMVASPLSRLLKVLSGNSQKLVIVLAEIKKKRG